MNRTLKTFSFWRISTLAVGTFAVGTDAFIVAAFLPSMAKSLGVSVAAAGQSVTVFAMGYALFAPFVATLAARLPRRALLVSSLLLLGFANLASALSPTLSALLVTRLVAAIAAAAYTPTASAVGASLVPLEWRARALAIVLSGLTIATALGIPLGNIASIWFGWRTTLALVASFSIFSAILLRFFVPVLTTGQHIPLRARLNALQRPGIISVLPLTVLGMAACYTPYAYSVPVLYALGATSASIPAMLFLYGLGAILGNLFCGYGTDRWGAKAVLSVTYSLMIITLSSLAWLSNKAPHLGFVAFLMLTWGASSWAQTAAQTHRLISAAPSEAPLVVALNSSAIYFGIAIGTAFGGIAAHYGPASILWWGAGLAICAILFLGSSTR